MREGICRKCRLGYASLQQQSCLPCPNNTYGKRCAETCECTAHERCDRVKGCTNTFAALNNTTDIFVEDTYIQPSLKTTDFRKRNDTTIKPSLKTTENRDHNAEETTTNNASLSSKGTTILNEEKFTGNCRSEFKIVISGSIGLFIGVGVSVIFMVCIKIIQKRKDSADGETHMSSEIQMETLNNYEEINDIILISHDTFINQNEENSDTSRSSIDIEYRSQNDNNADYLNPYQPIVPITDNHLYKTMGTSADIITTDQDIAASQSSVDEQNNCTDKNDSSSYNSQGIDYAELELSTTDKYENAPMVSIWPTEDQSSTQNTQYAEIVQTV